VGVRILAWLGERVECAGQIQNPNFRIGVLALRVGDRSRLVLNVQPGPSNFISEWEHGIDTRTWSSGRYERVVRKPTWPSRFPSPWVVCSVDVWFDAPADGSAELSAVQIARSLLTRPRGFDLAALVREHGGYAGLPPTGRRLIDELFEEHLDGLQVASSSGLDECAADVSYRRAEELADAVTSGAHLSRDELEAIDCLLCSADFRYGYWGPIKRILKAIDPSVAPNAFGAALGRLSGSQALGSSEGLEYEPTVTSHREVASAATRHYMARRSVRQLRRLGKSDPQTYVEACASLLGAWDSQVTSQAYIPAYVLGGGGRFLSPDSRRVAVPLDATTCLPAHRQAWLDRPEAIRSLMGSVRRSKHVLVVAHRLLDEIGLEPVFTEHSLPVALASGYAPLVVDACRALPSYPKVLPGLSEDAWRGVWAEASEAKLAQIVRRLPMAMDRLRALYDVVEELIRDGGLGDQRDRLLLHVYAGSLMGARQWTPPTVPAVLLALRLGVATEHAGPWTDLASRLDPQSMTEVLVAAAAEGSELTEAAVALLKPLLLQEGNDASVDLDVTPLLEPGNWPLVRLAFALLCKELSPEAAVDFVSTWAAGATLDAAQRSAILAAMLAEADAVSRPAVITAALSDTWGLSAASQAALLLAPAFGPRQIWELLLAPHNEVLGDLVASAPLLLQAVGSTLDERDIPGMPLALAPLVLAYARSHPQRFTADVPFALALARFPSVDLQQFAIERIHAAGLMPRCWLQLAETGLPEPVRATRAWLQGLPDGEALTSAVIVCLDSPVTACLDLGIELLGARAAGVDLARIWNALAETRQPAVQRLVASPKVKGAMDDDRLAAFDRRVLTARRVNRAAKALVQARLDSGDPSLLAQPSRASALLELARGRNVRDREWALRSLARLADAGHLIDGVEVGPRAEGSA